MKLGPSALVGALVAGPFKPDITSLAPGLLAWPQKNFQDEYEEIVFLFRWVDDNTG